MSPLAGRTAIVTGGTSGIGLASARRLARAGVRVIIAGRDGVRGAAAEQRLRAVGSTVDFVACDVRSSTSLADLVAGAIARHGGLDLMVNAAGVEGPIAPLHEYPDEALEEVMMTNFAGVALGMKAALPAMLERGGGVIVNVASTIGTLLPFPGGVVYGGTKAAVVSMTAAAAVGYAPFGIRVYALQPWITDTPMIDRLCGGAPEGKAQMASLNPSGRIVEAEEVAECVLSLALGEAMVENGGGMVVDSFGEPLAFPSDGPGSESLPRVSATA